MSVETEVGFWAYKPDEHNAHVLVWSLCKFAEVHGLISEALAAYDEAISHGDHPADAYWHALIEWDL